MPDPKPDELTEATRVKLSQQLIRDKGTSESEEADRASEEAQLTQFEEFLIDEAGMETFPASDPPSWTPLTIMGHPHARPAPAEPISHPEVEPTEKTDSPD